MRAVGLGRHIFGANPFMGQTDSVLLTQCIVKGACTDQGIPVNMPPSWWGVISSNSDDKNSLITQNANIIWTQLSQYPFPSPFDVRHAIFFFYDDLQKDMVALANMDQTLDPDTVNMWITMEVINNYNAWADRLEQEAKTEEKKRKRAALRLEVGEAVGAIMMGIAAPAVFGALMSAASSAEQAYVSQEKAKQAADAMKEAAADFQDSDPEFSQQVTKTGDVLDLIGQAQTQAQAPPVQTPTVAPVKAAPASSSSGPSPLLVGGGLAAAGLAAFAIFGK